MNETVQICSRCLLPNTYPGIEFNEQGICNHCLSYKNTEPLGEEQLLQKISFKYGNKYDCVVGISGGTGSLKAVRNMGKNKWLVVIYREVSKKDGFIITAYFLDKRPKGDVIWKHS